MNPPLLVEASFGSWIRTQKKLIVIPSFGAIIAAVSWIKTHAAGSLHSAWLLTTLLGIQVVVIIAVQFFMPAPVTNPEEAPRASIAMRQFSSAWRTLWLFWFLEYLILTTRQALEVLVPDLVASAGLGAEIFQAAANFGNNLPTLALVILYVIASERTVRSDGDVPEADHLPWDRGIALLVLVTALDITTRLAVLTPAVNLPSETSKVFDWMSGIGAGLATALLIGRLDSKFIDLPTWAVIALYGYAVIQVGWPGFEEESVRAVLLTVALTLKLLLFVVIWWLFRSGVFLFFLERVGLLYDEVRDERLIFLSKVQRGIQIVSPTHRVRLRQRQPWNTQGN